MDCGTWIAAAAIHDLHLVECGSWIAAVAKGIEVPQYKPFYTVPEKIAYQNMQKNVLETVSFCFL